MCCGAQGGGHGRGGMGVVLEARRGIPARWGLRPPRSPFDFPQGERPPRPRMTLALGSCLRSNDAWGAGRRGLMVVEGPLRQAQGERTREARVRWGGGVGDGG